LRRFEKDENASSKAQQTIHNTYLQGIVRSVFAEWQTGQVVAQVLKGGDRLPSISPPFYSKQHGRMINCEKLLQFLKDEIPLTMLEQLRTGPCIICNKNAINEIAVRGLDIWVMARLSNQNTHQYCRDPFMHMLPMQVHSTTTSGWSSLAPLWPQLARVKSWRQCLQSLQTISCKNTLTPRKKLSKKNPPINQGKRQQEGWKTMMAPSDASEETEVGKKRYLTFSEWSSRRKWSFLK
jgi:hypothetical protein